MQDIFAIFSQKSIKTEHLIEVCSGVFVLYFLQRFGYNGIITDMTTGDQLYKIN